MIYIYIYRIYIYIYIWPQLVEDVADLAVVAGVAVHVGLHCLRVDCSVL